MQLQDFYDYKNRFAEDVLTDENLVHLITDDANYDMSRVGELMYSHVFPFEYMPETLEKAGTYLFIEVEAQRMTEETFFTPVIYVWIMCHKSKLRLPEGGVRTDALVSALAGKMNGSRMYGIGELDLYAVRRFSPIADYNGKMMTFHAREFNKPAAARNAFPVPANRKKGQ